MTAIHPHDQDTLTQLVNAGVPYMLLDRVENLAVEASAGRHARVHAEENHPARLLGVAQAAIRDALLLNNLEEVQAHLADALARIKGTEIPALSTRCVHPRTGLVTSHKPKVGLFEAAIHGPHAEAPVCDLPQCIREATEWVERMSRKHAYHVLDSERSAS